jgi:hypothetical protein
MQQIQSMQIYRRMLGLDQGGYGQPQQMQYAGVSQPGQQQRSGGKGSGGGMSPTMLSSLVGMLGTKPMVSSGITPTSINKFGEPYQGWGPQTGDWGAMSSPAMYDATTVGSTPAAESAFGGAGELSGTSGLSGSAAESAGLGSLGYITAAIMGQHLMSGATDRRTIEGGKTGIGEGHRTGDVFSGNFFTEPWMAFGEQKLGIDTPTAGEKTDAAIDRMREGKGGFSDFASTIPSTAYQWFDPVGNFGADIMSDKFGDAGKALTMLLMPHTGLKFGADWLGKLF